MRIMRGKPILLLVFVVLFTITSCPLQLAFADYLYGIRLQGLYRINLADGSESQLNWQVYTSLAYDISNGYLYGTRPPEGLYMIDPTNGLETMVFGGICQTYTALAYNTSDGYLYGATFEGLFRINLVDGSGGLVNCQTYTALAYNTSNGYLYGTRSPEGLYMIDPMNGLEIPFNWQTYTTLTYNISNGYLYGTRPPEGLYIINPADGLESQVLIQGQWDTYIGLAYVPKPTTISNISQNGNDIGRYEKFEATFTLDQNYTNPFDPCIIDVWVIFHEPGGNNVTIPAFYYQAYNVSGSNPEHYPSTSGSACWKARFAPSKLGIHTFDITIKDANGTVVDTNAGSFTCQESGKKGFIRVDPNNHSFMKYDNGDTRLNIGHHIGWCAGEVNSWNNYITKMHAAGENWTRLWMSWYGGDGSVILEWRNGWYGYFQGAGKLSMQTAQRLDRFVEIAEENDIAMHLALQHHGQFSSYADADWNNNPYNVEAGGFLDNPAQFFTDLDAIRLSKNKYRYIVARWGYSTSILAWELWNEVQWTDGWSSNQASVVAWHDEISKYIHSIDPFRHPVITSSHSSGFENIWSLPDIDTVQMHYYGMDTIKIIVQTALGLTNYNKPIMIEEIGAPEPLAGVQYPEEDINSLPEPYKTQMHEALMLHNSIWSSFHLKSSAHMWFWDYYIDPLNLYGEFTPLAIYAANENIADYNLSKAQRAVSGAQAYSANPVLSDFWAVSTQTVFSLDWDYFPGMENLSQWLHGSWESAYRSDPNFHLNMLDAGSLKIHVQSVSPAGDNSLQVLVNGSSVFSSGYPNNASDFIITVPLSAGQQTVQIKNTGQDWFHITSYEFVPNNISLLDSIGLSNNERAYIWIYDIGSEFGKTANGTFHNEPVIVKGLDNGSYLVEVYATRGAGGIIASGYANPVSGMLAYTLPDFSKDIAVKVTRVVNFRDFAAFADQWRQTGTNLSADLNHDGGVDLADLNVLAGYWPNKCPAGWPF